MNAVLTPSIKLVPNSDETYDLILEYNGIDVEFAEELDVRRALNPSKTITKSFLSQAKKVKIKSVKVLVSGVLVATVAFSLFFIGPCNNGTGISWGIYTEEMTSSRLNMLIKLTMHWTRFLQVTSIFVRTEA